MEIINSSKYSSSSSPLLTELKNVFETLGQIVLKRSVYDLFRGLTCTSSHVYDDGYFDFFSFSADVRKKYAFQVIIPFFDFESTHC